MTMLRQFLWSISRGLLFYAAGWLSKKGLIAAQDAPTYADAAASWLVPAVMSVVPVLWTWFAVKGRVLAAQLWVRLVVHAAAAPAGTPIATIEAAVKAGEPLVVIAREVHVGTPADCDDEGPQAA